MKTHLLFSAGGLLLLLILFITVMLVNLFKWEKHGVAKNLILAGPMGMLTGYLLTAAGAEPVELRLAFLMGMAGICAHWVWRQSWTLLSGARTGLYRPMGALVAAVALAVLGTGCAGMGHKNDMSDIEFEKDKGKVIEGPSVGPFSLFGYYGGVARKTDSRAVSGASGLFADKSLQGFHAETVGVKGDTRKYGIQSYESKIRADAITAALDPLKNIVSDVVRAYLAGPAGDIWAGAATTEEKLTKTIEVAKDDPKAPEGTVDELTKVLEKLKK